MPKNSDEFIGMADRGVSRRAIVKGAAWSVPAVILATAVPAAATDSGNVVATSVTGVRGTPTGRTTFTITFTNTSPGDHTVNWSMPALAPISVGGPGWSPRTGSLTCPKVRLQPPFDSNAHEVVLNVLVVELGVAKACAEQRDGDDRGPDPPSVDALRAPITG